MTSVSDNSKPSSEDQSRALDSFHPVLRQWFEESFEGATSAQCKAWPSIAGGLNSLLLAPTGSGKTLAAFLVALNRLMFAPSDHRAPGVRVLYISPLKALGVDVERNLKTPLAGVRAVAEREGEIYHEPTVGVRSGDTPSVERQRLVRNPPEILITTPESLYLMLTSKARETLLHVETVIIDEIHTMVASKRGTHLFVSLERLEALRQRAKADGPLQRIGLSATQRPLREVAKLLGGAQWDVDEQRLSPRHVEIIDAGQTRRLELTIEVPVEDMRLLARHAEANAATGNHPATGNHLATGNHPATGNSASTQDQPAHADLDPPAPIPNGSASGPSIPSIWPAMLPRLIELIDLHRSTMIFVNSRRLAERLATSINEESGRELALAHHGSIAKDTRAAIEDRLKRGDLPAIVATSSLELGIDMGAVDLVVQIEAPPTIASGLQRIGRAGHHVGGQSKGIVFPKYRGDLLACSAAAKRMLAGEVEETFYPRNPLDVLAQQIVAIVADGPCDIELLFQLLRQAAPFNDLPRSSFDSVVDLLSGRYPSDEFSELRPRINWDRISGTLSPRKGTQRLAIVNAGTIPDRGLYGVFLTGDNGKSNRVGELDEEMVFETRPGDVFLLGASSWRVVEITHDRVEVVPAPGETGRMPFWRGDGPGRPLEFGRAVGELTRRLLRLKRPAAKQELITQFGLQTTAAENLLQYLHDQADATGEAPSDRVIVVESFLDEIGDWRLAILTPFGARVHAPWAIAIAARLREEMEEEVDMIWSDDGMMFRLAEGREHPSLALLFPQPDEIEDTVVGELGSTALFAGRFRENAARSLLLPKRQPGKRTPLWLQRRRSADLLTVAAQYPNFPVILETYRECLRDVFDLKGLKQILDQVVQQQIRVEQVETRQASPFSASLLFNYTANFLYNGDAPLAERRAQTLSLDQSQLSELLGTAEMRELLCAEAIEQTQFELQRLDPKFAARDSDELTDRLRDLGAMTRDELAARTDSAMVRDGALDRWLQQLQTERRVIEVRMAGETRYAPAEEAGRYRDALGVMPPPGLPAAFLESPAQPLVDLVAQFARTHVPFLAEAAAARLGLGLASVVMALEKLESSGRVIQGEFLPGQRGREWTDTQVLRRIKRRSLAQLRKQIEPVEQVALARFLPQWQGVTRPKQGLDGLLDVIEQMQGVALPGSVWEQDIFPSRIVDYQESFIDELCAAGEVAWFGRESLGTDDGRIVICLTDHLQHFLTSPSDREEDDELAMHIEQLLSERGALFFDEIAKEIDGFRPDMVAALWRLVWAARVTNDTFAPLRARRKPPKESRRTSRRRTGSRFRSRRAAQPVGSEGRWTCLAYPEHDAHSATAAQLVRVTQLVERYGVLTRELAGSEQIKGGFAAIYPVLKAMEESGKIRRGYFVEGLGATQFAAPGAEERLRFKPDDPQTETTYEKEYDGDSAVATEKSNQHGIVWLAATDPANPFGTALPWPETDQEASRPTRTAGARVLLIDGQLVAYVNRTRTVMQTFLPTSEPEYGRLVKRLAVGLALLAERAPVMLDKIDGQRAVLSPLAEPLCAAGFIRLTRGLLHRGSE